MLIDSHVNLHAPQFDDDRDAVISRAREAGVELMVEISDKLSTFEATHRLAMAHPDIWCTVGVHPHEAKDHLHVTPQDLVALAQRPRVVGIGECGLDFHYDLSPRDQQEAVFRTHIAAARATGLPLVIHTRQADARMAAILKEEAGDGRFRFLMHCYTSGPELAEIAAEMGAWFSVSGIATFKAAEDVRNLIRSMPADRILYRPRAPGPGRHPRVEPSRGGGADDRRLLRPVRPHSQAGGRVNGTMEVTILGCGSSGGVPRGDGDWGACDPAEPKNRRTRCSMLARRRGPAGETTVLIDTSPDLREQMLEVGVSHLDAVLYTHDHADQTHGIDDLRVFALRRRKRIPAWMDAAAKSALAGRFDYIFESKEGYPAIVEARDLPSHGVEWSIEGSGGAIPDQAHGPIRSVGYRLGPVSYSSDVSDLDDAAIEAVRGSALWIIDALRWTRHPTHAHLDQTVAWIARAAVGRAVLTNLHIDLDYKTLQALVPRNVEVAHDGWHTSLSL
jgi:phosphoribosyl 1,2-cyclic phosphate phosphodiesterase